MHKKQLIERVSALAAPICEQNGVALWDVSFEKEGKAHVLTIFIDRADGGVFIEDCERVSRAVDPLLDEKEFDSLPSYTLSVSSAGMQRRLTRNEHLDWATGREIEVSFYKAEELGERAIGELLSFDAHSITIKIGGVPTQITREKIAGMRAHFRF